MRTGYFFLALTFLVFTGLAHSQSVYLDTNYGNAGVATIPSTGQAVFYLHTSLDSKKNLYVGALNYKYGGVLQDSFLYEYAFRKLDSNGELQDWGTQGNGLLSNLWEAEQDVGWHWQQDDLIFGLGPRKIESDSSYWITQYDLDLNPQSEYPINILGGLYSFYLYRYVIQDNQNRLITTEYGSLKRYLSDGSLDVSYGNNGQVRVFDNGSFLDSTYYRWYDSIILLEDQSVLFSSYLPLGDSTSYRSAIAKINPKGTLDKTFGQEGYFYSDSLELITSIYTSSNGDILLNTSKYDSLLCNPSNFHLKKIDANGQLYDSYGKNGSLIVPDDCITYQHFDLIGPEGHHLILSRTEKPGIDSTLWQFDYNLHRYKPNGQMDNDFGENGNLDLGFIPGNFLYNAKLDNDYNLYLIKVDSISTDNTRMHIAKLKATELWPNIKAAHPETTNFTIFPNPSTGEAKVKYEGPDLLDANIALLDINARLISSRTIPLIKSEEDFLITTLDLTSGTYYVRIRDSVGRSIFGEKLLVIK